MLLGKQAQVWASSHRPRTPTHNQQVLVELDDIIDLPARAEMVEGLLADDGRLVAAFEGLTVLEGTGGNVKEAWRRNARAGRADLGELMQYLKQVRVVGW